MYGIGPDDKLSCVSLPDAPLLRAARRAPVPYTPVWLMRQAGRYLPEYRAMRERFGFLELCRNPEAATAVTLEPVDRLGVDAAILFADILLVVAPMGVGLEFAPGAGPVVRRPVRSPAVAGAGPAPYGRGCRHPLRYRHGLPAAAHEGRGRQRDRARLAGRSRRGLGPPRVRRGRAGKPGSRGPPRPPRALPGAGPRDP